MTAHTGYENRTFTINLTVAHEVGIVEDLRLYFTKPPDHFASTVNGGATIKFTRNGQQLAKYCDYIASQQGTGPIDLSVLFHNFRAQAGDTFTITMSDTSEPIFKRAALLKTAFEPCGAVRHLLSP